MTHSKLFDPSDSSARIVGRRFSRNPCSPDQTLFEKDSFSARPSENGWHLALGIPELGETHPQATHHIGTLHTPPRSLRDVGLGASSKQQQ